MIALKHLFCGSDHAGFCLKEALKPQLSAWGVHMHDQGVHSTEPVDYPDTVPAVVRGVLASGNVSTQAVEAHAEISTHAAPKATSEAVLTDRGARAVFGLLICGSGIGMSMAANRFAGIRAALCYTSEAAALARQHNNANILVLGARRLSLETAQTIVSIFLETPFAGGRHVKRLEKLDAFGGGTCPA